MFKSGDRFFATDKLGNTYEYQFEGVDPAETGYIVLINLTLSTKTRTHYTTVEREWFGERKIKRIWDND